MKINQVHPSSFIDYPGRISIVLFAGGCNFRCPACHAKNIVCEENNSIDNESLWNYLVKRRKAVNSVVLCGGEPTLYPEIYEFIHKLKLLGYSVKLDTNASRPDVLEKLIRENLIDYVAVDIKAPPQFYSNVCGSEIDISKIEKSIKLLNKFSDYEFRTTIVPFYEDDKNIRFLNTDDIIETAGWIKNLTAYESHKYFIQKFISRKGELLDPRMELYDPTSEPLLKNICKQVKKILPNCEIR